MQCFCTTGLHLGNGVNRLCVNLSSTMVCGDWRISIVSLGEGDKDLNPHCSAYTLISLGSTVVPIGSCAEICCEFSAS